MIAIFDEDGGGDVDFREFVSGLSAFSSRETRKRSYDLHSKSMILIEMVILVMGSCSSS